MSAVWVPPGKQTFVDINGKPLVGGKVYHFIPETSMYKDTWVDEGQTALNTNPIILDMRGQCTIWGTGLYRQRLEDANGNEIWDRVTGFNGSGGGVGDLLELWISTAGDDTNPGTEDEPLYSLKAAFDLAMLHAGDVQIHAGGGQYFFSSTAMIYGEVSTRTTIIPDLAPLISTFSAITAVSGVDGNYQVTAQVPSTAGWAAGDVIYIEDTVKSGAGAAANNHLCYRGPWRITSIVDGTHVRFRYTGFQGAPPTGAITGTVRILKTVFNFAGVSGINCQALAGISNCAIVGSDTSATFGLLVGGLDVVQPGAVFCGPYLAVIGFTDNFRPNYGAAVHARRCGASGAENNGWQARGAGSNITAFDSLSSGNGFGLFGGGGNGFLGQLGGAVYLANCEAHANFGKGFYGRTTGNVLCDNGSPPKACRNYDNYGAGQNGFVQSIGSLSYNALHRGYYAEFLGQILCSNSVDDSCAEYSFQVIGGSMTAEGCTAQDPGLNGFTADDGGTIRCNLSIVNSPVFNGFVARNHSCVIAANTAVNAPGGLAYFANNLSYVSAVAATGALTTSPAFNTLGTSGGYVEH